MRRLLLLRHAKAERAEPGTKDLSRVLIDRGRKDAAKIGTYMASHALVPDRVILSPAARTQETWKYAATAFHPAPAAMSAERIYGHTPGLHDLALMLVAAGDVDARELLREKLPTSGLVIIDFAFDNWSKLHPQSGRLERFVSPKSLEAAAN